MTTCLFTLYIAGQTIRSQRAVFNLRQICEELIPGNYQLTIVDVLENPELAEKEKIFATPTLIKESSTLIKRVIGDLSNKEQLITVLDLNSPFTGV